MLTHVLAIWNNTNTKHNATFVSWHFTTNPSRSCTATVRLITFTDARSLMQIDGKLSRTGIKHSCT